MMATSSNLDDVSRLALRASSCLSDQQSEMGLAHVSSLLSSELLELMYRMRRLLLILHHLLYDMYSMSQRRICIQRPMPVGLPIPFTRHQRYLSPMLPFMRNLFFLIGQ
jgi:hypothetical protein